MQITEVTRAQILDRILLSNRRFYGKMDLIAFLKRIWDLPSMPSTDRRFSDAAGDIWQHCVRNDDWSDEELLCGKLDLREAEDSKFAKFLETCLHPLAIPNEVEAASLAQEYNDILQHDGLCLRITSRISGKPVYTLVDINDSTSTPDVQDVYEIALSFAGEDRAYVEEVATYLKKNGVRCFYDGYEEATLWGKDLVEHLASVYQKARYCVMFISTHYATKMWPSHERKNAMARAVEEKGEYILPARFDDTQVPGIRHTLSYIDLRSKTPEGLGLLILQKLGRKPVEDFTW